MDVQICRGVKVKKYRGIIPGDKEKNQMTSKHYMHFNPNDKDKKDEQSDCVIRALCKVMNKTWLMLFQSQ